MQEQVSFNANRFAQAKLSSELKEIQRIHAQNTRLQSFPHMQKGNC